MHFYIFYDMAFSKLMLHPFAEIMQSTTVIIFPVYGITLVVPNDAKFAISICTLSQRQGLLVVCPRRSHLAGVTALNSRHAQQEKMIERSVCHIELWLGTLS